MATAQAAIFALGTVEHLYLELDVLPGVSPRVFAAALASLIGPTTTVQGVNAVVGSRTASRWPATQHDGWLWIAGGSRDVVFDWRHHAGEFVSLPVEAQEQVIGRTRADSVELAETTCPPTRTCHAR